jgi:hypothetical protein
LPALYHAEVELAKESTDAALDFGTTPAPFGFCFWFEVLKLSKVLRGFVFEV